MAHKCSVTGNSTPTLFVMDCPDCGEELEFFSNEKRTKCSKCGKVVNREETKKIV